MRNLYLILSLICTSNLIFSQTQQISWRTAATSGEWFETNPCGEIGTADSQWLYPHFGGNSSRNAPNCFGIYDLVFDNNHELTMNNSESFFNVNRITFEAGNTSTRTLNGEGIDLINEGANRPIIRNLSTANHEVNLPIALQNSPVEFNPINGNLSFQNTIFTNGNFIDVFGNNGNTLNLSGVISGTGGIALKQNSTIDVEAAMTYTGGTAVEAGTFRLLAGGDLANETAVTISTGGTFNLNDQNLTVRSVSETANGNGGTLALGSGTLTIAGNYTGDRFQNTITGTGNLVKNGTGNWVLYGNNTFTGTTTINAGTVRINNPNGLGTTDGLVTVNDGAALSLNAAADYPAQNLVLNGTGIANAGALRKVDTGNRIFAGGITINSNTRFNATGGTLLYDGAMNLNGNTMYFGGSQNFQFRASSSLSNATKTSGDGAIFKDGSGFLWIRPNLNLTGNVTLVSGEIRQFTGSFPSDGKVIIRGGVYRSDGTTDRTIPKNVDIEGSFTLGHTGGGAMIISGNVDLTGANRNITTPNNNRINGVVANGGITKLGTGILSLAGANTYSGNTNIQAGSIRLSAGGDLSDATEVRISSGASFNLNNQDVTVASVSETGVDNAGVVALGSGTLSINATYTGTRFQNSISGTGNLVKSGTGTLSLFGAQTYTGTTTVNGGTLATSVDLASSEVIVNASGTFSVTENEEVTIQDMNLASGATINLEPGSILNVTGAFEDNGLTITGTGELRVIRSSASTGNWTSASSWNNNLIPNSDFDFITLSHDVDLDIDYEIKNRLLIESGNTFTVSTNQTLSLDGTLTMNGDLLFKNTTATNAAQFGEVASGSTINGTGSATLERFIPAQRAFRLFATGVNTTTSIQDNWQEGANMYNEDLNPGFGTHITGIGTSSVSPITPNVDGFDWNPSGNPSLFTFSNTSYSWTAVPNTNTETISAELVYRLFVRGDRSIDISSNTAVPEPTTIRTKGTLNSGSNSINLNTNSERHNFIPNPFHAIIDVQSILEDATHLNERYYWVWDPSLSERGAFVVVDLDVNAPINPISGDEELGSSANRYVMPGQSFAVYSNEVSPTLSIAEAHKASAQPQTEVFSENASNEEVKYINVRLFETNAFNEGNRPRDGLAIRFKPGGNNAIDDNDAPKLMNTDENLCVFQDGKLIQIEERDLPQNEDEIQFYLDNKNFSNYVFDIDVDCGDDELKLFFVDQYTQDEIELENGNQQVIVDIDPSITASNATNRFKLVFEEVTLSQTDFDQHNLSIYPNPAEEVLHINWNETPDEEMQISIFNLVGKKVGEFVDDASSVTSLPVKNLSSGVYLLKIQNEEWSVTKKFIKQ